jgi:PAS domain S-box-containing protein
MENDFCILVVDDDLGIRELMAQYLNRLSYNYILAKDSAEALSNINETINLVISDIEMPGMNGITLLKKIKQKYAQIDVIIMTGHFEKHNYVEVIQAGAIDFITKPFVLNELNAKLKRCIKEQDTQRALGKLSDSLEKKVQERTLELEKTNQELQYQIEERQYAQAELTDSKKRYKRISKTISNYIYTVKIQNNQAVETIHNSACFAITGYQSEDFSADDSLWINMIPKEDRYIVLKQINSILHYKNTETIEHRIIRKDGKVIWIKNTPIPNYNREGQLISYDGVICDIHERKLAQIELIEAYENLEIKIRERTVELGEANSLLLEEIEERKQVEDKLIKAAAKLQQTTQYKSEFLANMSHEIRTPMNAIIGMVRLAFKHEIPDKVREYLKIMETSGQILLGVINDILDFSKIESGKLNLETIEFNLHDMLKSLETMFTKKAQEKRNIFTIICHENIPDTLFGDPLRINQILINLVSNAMKFTVNGHIKIEIICNNIRNQKAEINFSINDSGIGIPSDKFKKILSPFEQVDQSVSRKSGGSGLGLAICTKLLTLYDSKLIIKSKPGKGSTFSFNLLLDFKENELFENDPLDKRSNLVDSNIAAMDSIPEYSTSTIDEIRGARILLVEDNIFNQILAVELLKNAGLEVDVAENGLKALKMISNGYDGVLMDIQMPEMDGYETTRKIRKTKKENNSRENDTQIPIIAMTAHALDGDREKCLAAGMNDYISKPFSPETIYTVLAKHINGSDQAEKKIPGSSLEIERETNEKNHLKVIAQHLRKSFNLEEDKINLIINSARNSLNNELSKAQEYLDEGSIQLIPRIGHTMKGILVNIDLKPQSLLAAEIETHQCLVNEKNLHSLQEKISGLKENLSFLLEK